MYITIQDCSACTKCIQLQNKLMLCHVQHHPDAFIHLVFKSRVKGIFCDGPKPQNGSKWYNGKWSSFI